MTVQECYGILGDYTDVKNRFMTDKLIEKFMLKFPADPTMQQLWDSLETEDYETAFRAAHTLKGVAANLGFSVLQKSASDLTEALRAEKKRPDDALVEKVEKDYSTVLETIEKYQNEHA